MFVPIVVFFNGHIWKSVLIAAKHTDNIKNQQWKDQPGANRVTSNSRLETDGFRFQFYLNASFEFIYYDTIQRLHSKTDRTCQFSLTHKN